MFQPGEKVMSRFGLYYEVLEETSQGWLKCRREDGNVKEIHVSDLRKLPAEET